MQSRIVHPVSIKYNIMRSCIPHILCEYVPHAVAILFRQPANPHTLHELTHVGIHSDPSLDAMVAMERLLWTVERLLCKI